MTRRPPAVCGIGTPGRTVDAQRGAPLVQDSAVAGGSAAGVDAGQDVIVQLIPLIRRVVAARVRDRQLVDDLVQETLARVISARHRIERDTLAPYAVAVARNLVVAAG